MALSGCVQDVGTDSTELYTKRTNEMKVVQPPTSQDRRLRTIRACDGLLYTRHLVPRYIIVCP
jgi:hypothetical protein